MSSLYDDLMKEGKKLAAQGKLYESLSKFEHARRIQETPKVLERIQRLKEFIKEHKVEAPKSSKEESYGQKVEKTKYSLPTNKTLTEGHKNSDVLQEIQNVTEIVELPDNPSELSPANLNEFNKLKKEAMSFSYEGRFQDALNTFQKALQLCNCPIVKKYIKDIKVMIAKHDTELEEFRQLTYSGNKLAHDGKQNLSVKKLKDAYDICPSPKISKIIETLDDENNSSKRSSTSKKLFNESNATNKYDSLKSEDSSPNAELSHKSSEVSSTSDSIVQRTPSESGLEGLSPTALCKFKNLCKKARSDAGEGRLQESLSALKEALLICKTEKVLKRIKDLENVIKNSVDGDDEMVAIADGFSIFHGIYEKLYPYQRLGVAWMYDLFKKRKGGVLGDDMGLGKTFQVIAFLSGLIDADLVNHVLIIMPVSLLTNWEREFAKWCPGIKVYLYHGTSKKERERNGLKVQRKGHVLLTSYGMVVSNLDYLAHCDGSRFIWDYVILDEGHKIKNPTKTTKAVHEIPAKNRLVLTGTPIQNNLRELWALYDFVQQGALLGSMKTFKMQYENIITRSREKDATAGEKRLGTEMAENLKKLIQPYFLRRTKSEIWDNEKADIDDVECKMADLRVSDNKLTTRKNDLIIWLSLSDQQCEIYRNFLHSDAVKNILMSRRSPLVELTTLKKICDHPRLLSQRACLHLGLNGEVDNEDLTNELSEESAATSSIENVSDETLIIESGKMKFLISLLENLKQNEHRTLVFSLSRKILDMIHRILVNRQWKVLRLDGTITKTEERERRIQLFQRNSSYPVFLLTTQVGGVGITLTAADRVVIYDPSWNPATDAQAVDRAYRIGQKNNVVIYRLMTCGTVEEKIYRRQIFKDSITRQATGSSDPYRYFSKQELRELFVLDNPNYSATQVQLSQMHSGERKSDCSLDEHIAFLLSLDIFGLSDHDLMFSKNIKDDTEDNDESAISHDYIKKQVAAAQERIQAEAAVVEDGLRLAGSYTRPYTEKIPLWKNNTEKDSYKPPSFPDIIDLTQEEAVEAKSLKSSSHSDNEEGDISSLGTPKEGVSTCKIQSAKKKDNLKYKPLNLEKNKITDYYCPETSSTKMKDMSNFKETPSKDYSISSEYFKTPHESLEELSKNEKLSHTDASPKKQLDFNNSVFTEGSDSVIYDGSRMLLNSSESSPHSEKADLSNELNTVEEHLNVPGTADHNDPNDPCTVEDSLNYTGKADLSNDNMSSESDIVKECLNVPVEVDQAEDNDPYDLPAIEYSLNKTGRVNLSNDLDAVQECLNGSQKIGRMKDESCDLYRVENSLNNSRKADSLNDNLSSDLNSVGESFSKTGKADVFREYLSRDSGVSVKLETDLPNKMSIVVDHLNKTTNEFETSILVEDQEQGKSLVEKEGCASYGSGVTSDGRNDHSLSNINLSYSEKVETSFAIQPDIKDNCSYTAIQHSLPNTSFNNEQLSSSVQDEKFSPVSDIASSKHHYSLSEVNKKLSTHSNTASNLCSKSLQIGRYSLPGVRIKNSDFMHHSNTSLESSINSQSEQNLIEEKKCLADACANPPEIFDDPSVSKPETNSNVPYSPSDQPQDVSAVYKTSSPVADKGINFPKDLSLFLNESLNEMSFISRRTSTLKNRKSCARNMHIPSESDSSHPGSTCASPEPIVSESEEEVSDDPENSVASIPLSIPSTPLANIRRNNSPRITPLRLCGNYVSPKNSPFAKALASSPLIQAVDKTPEKSYLSDDSPIRKMRGARKNLVCSDSEDEPSPSLNFRQKRKSYSSSPDLSFRQDMSNCSSSNESSDEMECFMTPKSKPNSVLYSSKRVLNSDHSYNFSD